MIDTAIIPVAGLGTRLRPVSAVVPKAMFPLIDSAGRLRTVLHMILAETRAAGAERVGLIVSPGQEAMLRAYFDAAREHAVATGADADLPDEIQYILQPKPEGFGEAVLRAAGFVPSEAGAFLLMLGDHVYVRDAGAEACAAQVARAFAEAPCRAMIGMQPVGVEELPRVGAAGGEPTGERLYRCRAFVEKPDAATARATLATPGLPDETFLAHAGIYAFTPEIFDCLRELASAERSKGQEVQLADAQSMLLARHPEEYLLYRIAGRALDTGTPTGYAATLAALAQVRSGI